MPRVSVVIPTYNRAELVCEAIDSVLNQSYRDYEVIVVDDGSTDHTLEVLSTYDKRIIVINQDNKGVGAARNIGIQAAQGEYLAFLDSDDIWLPDKLERQMSLLSNFRQLAWVYSDAYFFDGDSRQILYLSSQRSPQYHGNIAGQLLIHGFIPSPTPVIRHSVFEDVGLFSQSVKIEDWDMWLRIASKYPIGRISKALAGVRLHHNMKTPKNNNMLLYRRYIVTIENAVKFAPEVYTPYRKRALVSFSTRTGEAFASLGQIDKARMMFLTAIKLDKMLIKPYIFYLGCLLGREFLHFAIRFRRFLRSKDTFRKVIRQGIGLH